MLSKISVKWLSDGGYFCKIVPSWTCDMVLNTPLTIFFIGINIVLMLMLVAMAEEELTWSIIIPYIDVISTFVALTSFLQSKLTSMYCSCSSSF